MSRRQDKGKGRDHTASRGSASHGMGNPGNTGKGKHQREDAPPPELDMTVVPKQSEELKNAQNAFIAAYLIYCNRMDESKSTHKKGVDKRDTANHYVELQNIYINELKAKQLELQAEGDNVAGQHALALALSVAEHYLGETNTSNRTPVFDGTNDVLVRKKLDKYGGLSTSHQTRALLNTKAVSALEALQRLQHQKRDGEDITDAAILVATERSHAAEKQAEQHRQHGSRKRSSDPDNGEGSSGPSKSQKQTRK